MAADNHHGGVEHHAGSIEASIQGRAGVVERAQDGRVRGRGVKHVLGIWVQATEGAKFWAGVCAELANRGVRDVLIACCDGLSGFPEAIEATWPHTVVQTCTVHLIRASLRFVPDADQKAPARSRALVLEPDRTALIEQRFADLGLKLTYGAHVDEIDDFTSSPIASRVTDLHDAFADPAVRGILTVTSLLQLPDASQMTALIIGRFQRASAVDRPILQQIIERQPVLVGLPVLANIDIGHTSPLATLPIGGHIEVDSGTKPRLRVLR